VGFGEWSDATGLLYLRARYYLPQAGIFTARDPFPGLTTLPVTLQPYLYAAGNPLRYTDPSGEISGELDLGAGNSKFGPEFRRKKVVQSKRTS